MRYTHHRGLAAVTRWVRLKYAAMNLKKLATWSWKNSFFFCLLPPYTDNYNETPVFLKRKQGFFDRLPQKRPSGESRRAFFALQGIMPWPGTGR